MAIFSSWQGILSVKSPRKLYVYAILVGAICGLVAISFALFLDFFEHLLLNNALKLVSNKPSWNWLIFLAIPIGGFTLAGFLVERIDKDARGAGMNEMIRIFHHKSGHAKFRTAVVKYFATALVLCTGGSGGREGPMAQIGASIASRIARITGMGPKAMRSIFLAGVAGALGAIFRAPLGAAITAIEIVYREDYESESMVPATLASITGYFVFTTVAGFEHTFTLAAYRFTDYRELLFYLGLGILCALAGWLFLKLFHGISNWFEKIRLKLEWKGAIGGLAVGLIGLISTNTLGDGAGFLNTLMNNETMPDSGLIANFLIHTQPLQYIAYFILLFALKAISTSFTIGSGGSAGVFGPSLFMGACLGASVGMFTQLLFPDIVDSYVPFIVVGMAGFFAGVANAPIGAVIMVIELTANYELLPPLLSVAVISLISSRHKGIYPEQVDNKFDSPVHAWDMTYDFLMEIPVKSMTLNQRQCLIDGNTKSKDFIKLVEKSRETDFIIATEEGKYQGMISVKHFSEEQRTELRKSKILLSQYADASIPTITQADTLSRALDILINHSVDKLPVIGDHGQLSGYIRFQDILQAYRNRLLRNPKSPTFKNSS